MQRPSGLIKREEAKCKCIRVRFKDYLNESRECFMRVNIHDRSIPLPDTTPSNTPLNQVGCHAPSQILD